MEEFKKTDCKATVYTVFITCNILLTMKVHFKVVINTLKIANEEKYVFFHFDLVLFLIAD